MLKILPMIIAVMFAGTAAAGTADFMRKDYACTTPPQAFAVDLLTALESSEDPNGKLAVYQKGFGRTFQTNFSFQVFDDELESVMKQLGVGAPRGRSLESRLLVNPYIAPPRDGSQPPGVQRRRQQAQGYDRTMPFDVVMITSSSYGKIEQRVTVACEDGAWKAFGVWYNPAR